MNEEVELIPMEDGKFYMTLEDVNKSIEVATFKLQQENQSLKDRMKMINELLKQYTPTYASCVKLLDEIELFAKGDK